MRKSVLIYCLWNCLNCMSIAFMLRKESKFSPRIVQTRYGRLQGLLINFEQSKSLKPIEVFLGVPYATPPVHSNRFSPTRTPSPWDGVRIADKLSPVCPQRLPDIRNETASLERMPRGRYEFLKKIVPMLKNQSEDCLYLNIFAPFQDEIETKNPVVIFIHGESFEWNSANPYDGSLLSSYTDLVVVTINYRLGFLGFLNANPSPHLKARVANYGLMDQMAALHWIQQNIVLFGGDPNNITLLGHGTGAACINFLMMSPSVVPGLFHRAILLSGSALSSWSIVDDPVTYAVQLATGVNCTIPLNLENDHERIVDCLRSVSLDTLMSIKISSPAYLNAFGPSVDGVVITKDFSKEILSLQEPNDFESFLNRMNAHKKHPNSYHERSSSHHQLLSNFRMNSYDVLFGVVSSEALWKFPEHDLQNGFEGQRRDRILRTYVRNTYMYHLSEIFFTIVNEYTDWERTVQHPINTRDATIAALNDAQFIAPLVQMADLFTGPKLKVSNNQQSQDSSPSAKSFFYVFDYQTKESAYPQKMGTCHNEDLPYIFGVPLISNVVNESILKPFQKNYTKYEIALSESMMILVNNFIRTGNPNIYQKPDQILPISKDKYRFRSVIWEEYDSVHQKYLEIGLKSRMKNHYRAHQLSVWLRLIPELHRAGMEGVVAKHNRFKNHNNVDLYDGLVRGDPLSRMSSSFVQPINLSTASTTRAFIKSQQVTTIEPLVTTCITIISAANANPQQSQMSPQTPQNSTSLIDNFVSFEAAGFAAYNTALNVTIVIGCSLLILNILIFAGVYYRRDKTRLQVKALQQQQNQNFEVLTKHHYLHHHHHHQRDDDASNTTTMIDMEQPSTVTESLEILTPQSHYCLSSIDSNNSSFKTLPKKLPNSYHKPNSSTLSHTPYKTLPKNIIMHHMSNTPNLILEHQQPPGHMLDLTESEQQITNTISGTPIACSKTTHFTENQPLLTKNISSKLPHAAISEMRV